MARSIKILNISLSPELYDEIERTAEEESRTKSDMIREAFRQYSSNKKWAQIREPTSLQTTLINRILNSSQKNK